MDTPIETLTDLEQKASAGEALTRDEAERVLKWPALPEIGMLGEAARRARAGDRVTYGRVLTIAAGDSPGGRGEAVEVRLSGAPASAEDACARVKTATAIAAGATLTAYSLADLLDLVGSDHLALAQLAAALRAHGLEAVAEVPLDRLGDPDNAIEVVRAVLHGGLGAWRATVDRGPAESRFDLIERAAVIQRETGALKAFAPLPRIEDAGVPSTGYDDVRTIALAALLCPSIPAIQVDWPLYGPKLAQVAITFGANDIDGVSPIDSLDQGTRRAPREDVERQIRAAFAVPAARDGRYGPRS